MSICLVDTLDSIGEMGDNNGCGFAKPLECSRQKQVNVNRGQITRIMRNITLSWLL